MILIYLKEKLFQIKSIKFLKFIYSLVYFKICIIFACVHLFTNLSNYNQILDLSKLSAQTLKQIIDLRGLRVEQKSANSNFSLVELVQNSGAVYESELIHSEITNPGTPSKVFNSAGEFLESVDDSKDKVWLVHIVTGSQQDKFSDSHRFLDDSTWAKLNKLSKFGILTGTFNCKNDIYFCHAKNWHRPQLVLGLVKYGNFRYPKEFVELYNYDNIKQNKYSDIFKWLENILTERLVTDFSNEIRSENNYSLELFYIQNSSSNLPIYYSAMSVKYNRRAKFYRIRSEHFQNERKNEHLENLIAKCKINKDKPYLAKTPIYVMIDKNYCYNYGANLNELPNYVYLNQFLLFLHPDLNSVFQISFLFLNLVLILAFFDYNKSFLKQIAYGLVYLFIFNFILITLWLLSTNSGIANNFPQLNTSIYALRFLKWIRVLLITNQFLQILISFLRFFIFYYFYFKFYQAICIYSLICILFFIHTKTLNQKTVNGYLPLKHNVSNTLAIVPVQSSSSLSYPQSSSQDIDLEISVSELINQINGLTTIWLQSSTYADRLVSELPSVEYCKCFYVNRVKIRAFDETDREETTEDEENTNKETFLKDKCECGKNTELNQLIKSGDRFENFFSKFHHECTICLQKYSFGNIIIVLPCGHLFHKKCIYEWFMSSINYKCPVCRTSFYKLKKSI